MSLFDFFRNVMGFSIPKAPNIFNIPAEDAEDHFQNPDTNIGLDNEDDMFRGSELSVYASPLDEIQKHMIQRMNEMFKHFQMLEDPAFFGLTEVPTLEPQPPYARNPRGEVLKPGFEPFNGEKKIDSNLDDHINKFGLSSLFKGRFEPEIDVAIPTRIMGQSVVRKVIKRPDGGVENEEIVYDNLGGQQRTVTRTIGDQSYSMVTTTGPNGEHTAETLKNIDQGKLDDFMKRWETGKIQKVVPPQNPSILFDDFDFNKFFK